MFKTLFQKIKKIFSFLFMSKKKDIPTYIVENAETFAVSLVTSPAIEEEFLLFSKDDEEKKMLKFADEEKHLVVGAVMIPDKPIYRVGENGEEYNLVFSKEAIEGMAINFMKNYRQYNVTLQHEESATGIWLAEQWIKSDMHNDKSIAIGLNKELPVGTLFQSYYCDSNDLWNELKEGDMRGFSIEAVCDFSKFEKQFEKQEEEKEQNEIEPINIEDMSAETEVETPTEVVETVEQPTKEDVVEEVVETPTNETKEDVVVETPKEDAQPKIDNEVLQNLLEEIKSLKEANNELSAKVKDLKAQPSTKPLNTNAKPTAASNYANWREQLKKYM